MENNIQLITLAPLSDFFFGNERTFGQDNSHYYAKSDKFPQQTSLLGMLRYELLKSSPNLFDLGKDKVSNEIDAQKLIGTKGFGVLHDFAYGIIEGISPVFLLSPDHVPYFVSGARSLEKSTDTSIKAAAGFKAYNLLRPDNTVDTPYLIERTHADKTEVYDGKVGFETQLVGKDGTILSIDKVFHTVQRTNNQKEYDGSTDDAGFFKQDLYRLAPGWRFAFLAAFNQGLPTLFGDQRMVHLGAERRHFKMNIQDAPSIRHYQGITFSEGVFQYFEQLYGGNTPMSGSEGLRQTVLLSDAYTTTKVYATAVLAHTDKASFRHLNTHLKQPNSVFKEGQKPKSERYTLLGRGGCLFSTDPGDIETHLNDQPAFQRIGYNYFKTL